MTTSQGNLASLSRYIFAAPHWHSSAALALVLAGLTGIAVFDSPFVLHDVWQGLVFVGIPTVVAGVVTPIIDRRLGGQLTANRSSLLALACELLVVVVLVVAGILVVLTPFGRRFVFDALLVVLAAIFALRLLVCMAVSRQRAPVAAIPASVQTVVAAVLLFVYSGTIHYLEVGGSVVGTYLARPDHAPVAIQDALVPFDFLLLGVICLVHGTAVWGFLAVIDKPWRNSLGVSVLDFIQGFIGHLAENSRDLEAFFESIGEEALVPVTVASVRRPGGAEKARFVLPMIHPGPMGEIGGGNLPCRIAAETEGLAFAPHATAGHDFNLVTEREVDTVCETVERAYRRLEYTDGATRSRRVESGGAMLLGQAFGDDGLVVASFSPNCTDDVDYSVGLAARSEARAGGLADVALVDAHNCNDGLDGEDLGHVVPGSERSFDLIEGAGALGEQLSGMERYPIRMGTAWSETDWDPCDGIGPLGVRVALCEVADQRTAYVLIDGNNMEPGLRDRIVGHVSGVDEIEVMTSDTHVVNAVEAENQVGGNVDEDELLAVIDELVERAAADLEPVEVGVETEKAQVTVFGNDRTETLASTANAMVSMGTALAVATLLVMVGVSVLIFHLAASF